MNTTPIDTFEELPEVQKTEQKHERKSRKCKFTNTLNRIKSLSYHYKKQAKGAEKIAEFDVIRSLLKIPDTKLEEFNRINKLIGRAVFDRDAFVKEKYNIEPDKIENSKADRGQTSESSSE